MLQCILFSHAPSPLPLGFVCFLFVRHHHLEPSLEVVSDSNLESFFYGTVNDVASTIDYSKEPLDAGVVDSPPPKQRCRQTMSSVTTQGHKVQLHLVVPLSAR